MKTDGIVSHSRSERNDKTLGLIQKSNNFVIHLSPFGRHSFDVVVHLCEVPVLYHEGWSPPAEDSTNRRGGAGNPFLYFEAP